ncbi:MAG: hypothetical protein J0H20_20765, partial [Rhizobiales bacterium]|nr:hypothetical protein [Hyphomicrobiales bacterium]
MDGTRGARRWSLVRPHLRQTLLAATSLTGLALSAGEALAAGPVAATLNAGNTALTSALLGVVAFSVLGAMALMRARNRAEAENAALKLRLADFKA